MGVEAIRDVHHLGQVRHLGQVLQYTHNVYLYATTRCRSGAEEVRINAHLCDNLAKALFQKRGATGPINTPRYVPSRKTSICAMPVDSMSMRLSMKSHLPPRNCR